jgi:hypothetical protein
LNLGTARFALPHIRALNPKEGSDMRTSEIFPRILLSLALSIGCGIAVQTPASAEERGTLEQQMACTPDVFRLCGAQIPDSNRIVACLRENTPQLSGPCRAVFESSASVPPPTAPAAPLSLAPGRRQYAQ